MTIQKIESCLDHDEARFKEDGLVISAMVIAVCDAFSVPYDQNKPPIIHRGLGTGETVKEHFCQGIVNAATEDLVGTVRVIDHTVGIFHTQLKISYGLIKEPAYLSGLTFAAVKIDREIEILQCGDCIAIWRFKDGSVEYTDNPVKRASIRDRALKAQLQQQYGKENYRPHFTPLMMEQKNRDINNPESPEGYPALNGGLNLEMCRHLSLPTNNLNFLLLCTDGFLLFDWFNEPDRMKELADIVQEHGVHYQLRQIRESGQTTEAAAVAVWFD